MKSLIFTLPTTHATVKVNRQIKQDFKTKIVAAPKALKQYGCTIAILVPNSNDQQEIFSIVTNLGYAVKRMIIIER